MKESAKEISIIIATYNAEKTIERCLKSIQNQKGEQVELIIIDGKSTDNTVNIISKYHSIVDKVLSEPDQGIYDAWNKAINLSRSKWVMFIGADDYLAPDALKLYLNLISTTNNEKIDLISSQVVYISEKGQHLKVIGSEFNWNIFKRTMNIAHVASLHSTNLFKLVGIYNLDYKICADYELLMRKQENLKCLFIPEVTAYMQTGGMSFSVKALTEAKKIKQETGQRSKFITNIEFFAQLILYKLAKLKYK